MNLDPERVIRQRQARAWSQDELAIACGLNLRTIQRVEKAGAASLQTRKALASAFGIDLRELESRATRLTPCPSCGSDAVYRYAHPFDDPVSAGGATLLPGLGGVLRAARLQPCVCADCGHVRLFTTEAARAKLGTAKHWKRVED